MAAAKKCMEGVTWKYSTQAYYLDRIERVRLTKKRLEGRERMSDGFIVFPICERGKRRVIRSIHINERVVHRAENDLVLVPVLRPKLIYDNAASLKERGTRFALERLKVHLWRYFRKHGSNEGYILTADLHGYFDSIQHGPIFEEYSRIFGYDPDIVNLTMDFIDAFGDQSLGLGSQVSQMTAVFYPNRIDHFIKEQLKIKGYGRYMDDFYLIHEDKEYLKKCLNEIRAYVGKLGLELNEKTQISPLRNGIDFLGFHTYLTDSGKVIRTLRRQSKTGICRRLKKFKGLHEQGRLPMNRIECSYRSWRGHAERGNCYHLIRKTDKLYNELFKKEDNKCRKH